MKRFFLIGLVVSFFISCKKTNSVVPVDKKTLTETLKLRECKTMEGYNASICLDSLMVDSRCATNAICTWEGLGSIRLKYTSNTQTTYFRLRTKLGNSTASSPYDTYYGSNDTTINGTKISLKGLTPYPSIPASTQVCIAEIVLQ
jgi:hypothetical protein